MIRTLLAISTLVLLLAGPVLAAEDPAPATPEPQAPAAAAESKPQELKTEADKVSYMLGQNIGNYLKRTQDDLEIEMNMEIFMRGINDGLSGAESLMTPEEVNKLRGELNERMRAKQAELRKKREAERKVLGEKNQKEEDAFLAENKGKPGVITTESGLQYMVLTEGSGPKPKATDRVKVHYKGTLLDGTEFDSSYSRGSPATFAVNRVVRGWTEALQLMGVGSKYRLFIPSKLGYGTRGSGEKIGPNALLTFEVELLEIEPPELGPPAPPRRVPPSPKR